MDERALLMRTAELAVGFLDSLDSRPVGAPGDIDALKAALDTPLPEKPTDSLDVIERLAADSEQGLVASQSGRYFGFVVGAAHPAALAADWLVSTWDQNLGLLVLGPSTLVMENTAGRWCKELLGIPQDATFAFVTGCQMAHVTCLAAARQHVLEVRDWDVREKGLAGSPPITIFVGAHGHSTVDRALRYLGIGRAQVRQVSTDGEGRMDVAALRSLLDAVGDAPTIVCAQAGGVNTGAFDDLDGIADSLVDTSAWLHVDGAFGLWAAASPGLRHLVDGHERADSWATDAHKWLNVPYDCGIAFCAHPEPHRRAMTAHAAYYVRDSGDIREPLDWTPDHSRRARAVPVYAVLRALGRSGVAELVDSSCAHAQRFATGIAKIPGCEVLNDVALNQVLFRFADDEATKDALARVQASGVAWMSPTTWDGRAAIRLSVSSWRTSNEDIERTLDAFRSAAEPSKGSDFPS